MSWQAPEGLASLPASTVDELALLITGRPWHDEISGWTRDLLALMRRADPAQREALGRSFPRAHLALRVWEALPLMSLGELAAALESLAPSL